MHAAHRRPDGVFEYGTESYRLEDRERDHFAVRRLSDDQIVGELRFIGDQCEVRFASNSAMDQKDALEAIKLLLAEPRGILPLQ